MAHNGDLVEDEELELALAVKGSSRANTMCLLENRSDCNNDAKCNTPTNRLDAGETRI